MNVHENQNQRESVCPKYAGTERRILPRVEKLISGTRRIGDWRSDSTDSQIRFSDLAASVARFRTLLGNIPIQNMPAMQTQAVNLTGPDK